MKFYIHMYICPFYVHMLICPICPICPYEIFMRDFETKWEDKTAETGICSCEISSLSHCSTETFNSRSTRIEWSIFCSNLQDEALATKISIDIRGWIEIRAQSATSSLEIYTYRVMWIQGRARGFSTKCVSKYTN